MSADFGREITTAVLWLNRFEGMDIRCVRLVPYEIQGSVFLDIQQVTPLREAADYQVRLRKKDVARERSTRVDGRDFTRYHVIVDDHVLPDENKRNAVRTMVTELGRAGVSYDEIQAVLSNRAIRPVPGLLTDKAAVAEAFTATYPGTDVGQWFTEYPLLDAPHHQTYIVFKMWRRNTEDTLRRLSLAFPNAKVSFRAAD